MTKSSLAKFLVIMASFCLLFGFAVGAFFLREPDTCFLLATGRWIFEHQALPALDPFSYTFAIYPQNSGLVVYQWLSELIFFAIYRFSGTIGLTAFACLVLVSSFFIIPWQILKSFALGPLRSGVLLIWLALGTIDRLLLKPEIFSYLFLSLFILIAVKSDASKHSHFIKWKDILFLAAIMLVWANAHSGFVIGIIFTLLIALRDLFLYLYHNLLKTNKYGDYSPSWLIAFFACLSTSFLTPYGIMLWKYIPHLYFHPINQYIYELQPLSLPMMLHNFPLFVSFTGLLLLSSIQILRQLRQKISKSDFLHIIIAIVGIILAICCMRMATFALLLMLPLIASGFKVKKESDDLDTLAFNCMPALILFFSLFGSLSMSLLNNPTIPIKTASFAPPFAALKYIHEQKPKGNLLNDPAYGDVLIWNMATPPRVFIDTRFDAYPRAITEDYLTMRDCKSGWQKLLEKYNISWIFVPTNLKMCAELNKDLNWHLAYKDDIAEIFTSARSSL